MTGHDDEGQPGSRSAGRRLSAEQARELLGSARVASLGTIGPSGRPHLVPITFALAGDTIYTAIDAKPKSTRRLQRLANIRADPRVAVLADHYAEDWSALWWVRADGEATILAEPARLAAPLALLMARYPQYRHARPAGPMIVIGVRRWAGWASR
jgi:PPOX class probable F420-dependent enzyme